VIRVEDEILDGSVARQLGELKRVLNSWFKAWVKELSLVFK
jgi:hypothetical protein